MELLQSSALPLGYPAWGVANEEIERREAVRSKRDLGIGPGSGAGSLQGLPQFGSPPRVLGLVMGMAFIFQNPGPRISEPCPPNLQKVVDGPAIGCRGLPLSYGENCPRAVVRVR